MKYTVDYLDMVIIRSCQLACEGCCTFSDHKEINGLEEASDNEEAIAFWSKLIYPKRLHIFGGEPLMHPRFMEWFRMLSKYWTNMPIWVNTNGYYLDKLFDNVEELFTGNNYLFLAITKHTKDEPYGSLVDSNLSKLMDLILAETEKKHRGNFEWIRAPEFESEHKKFYKLVKTGIPEVNYSLISFCEQYNDYFVPHYYGKGITLKPWNSYDDTHALNMNHKVCHIKNYVQFYKGYLYKCPPRAVLNHTLDTYRIQNSDEWQKYYNDYQHLGIKDTEEVMDAWFDRQKLPENTCNMCGFMHSHEHLPIQQHLPKKLFKIKPV